MTHEEIMAMIADIEVAMELSGKTDTREAINWADAMGLIDIWEWCLMADHIRHTAGQ